MQVFAPFRISRNGLVAAANQNDHIRQMIEQLLFTSPGERVNHPDFGCGLLNLIFAPVSSEIVATNQFTVQSNLDQWLGDLIKVEKVEIQSKENLLEVYVAYSNLKTRERVAETFTRSKT
ncbi:MAG: GPW/gp25 family protein [Acidobacteriota bacterium]|nr:GPW/gp25 family protein [Acidobacteriota bacterium]